MAKGLIREVQVIIAEIEAHQLSKSGQTIVRKKEILHRPVTCITTFHPETFEVYDEAYLIAKCSYRLGLDYRRVKHNLRIHKIEVGLKDLGKTNYELNEAIKH